MAISKRLRLEVMRRDDYTCKYCRSTENELTIDHVVPTALGGSDDPSNLVAACKDCNSGKSATPPDAALVAQVSEDAVRWAAAMREAARQTQAGCISKRSQQDAFAAEWNLYTDGRGRSEPLPGSWRPSVDSWLDAGLTMDQLHELVASVMDRPNVKDRFRYFCGAAWNSVKQLQETARTLLDARDLPAPSTSSPPVQDKEEEEYDEDLPWEEQSTGADVRFQLLYMARGLSEVRGEPPAYWMWENDEGYGGVLHAPHSRCITPASLLELLFEFRITAHCGPSSVAMLQRYPDEYRFCEVCLSSDAQKHNGRRGEQLEDEEWHAERELRQYDSEESPWAEADIF